MSYKLPDLTEKTIPLRTDIMHLRTVGGVDQKLTFDNFMKGQRTLLEKIASYTILDTDINPIVLVDASGSDVTITLPTLADNQGAFITVIQADAVSSSPGTITVDSEGSEEINGETEISFFRARDNITLYGGPDEWIILYTSWQRVRTASASPGGIAEPGIDVFVINSSFAPGGVITLPASADPSSNDRQITIKCAVTSTYAIFVEPYAGDDIDGYTSIELRQGDSVTIVEYGNKWAII